MADSLVRMHRDRTQFPQPWEAEVSPSMVTDYAIHGWQVDEDQPESVKRLAEYRHAGPSIGRVAILCPGPSLAITWPAPGMSYGATIGVNRAAHVQGGVDWWCAMDPCVWRMWGWANPRVGICGSTRLFLGDERSLIPDNGTSIVYAEVPEGCANFTMLAAIGFAFEKLSASAVDLFGCDHTGETDFHGEKWGGRGADRWKAESEGLEILKRKYGAVRVIKPGDQPQQGAGKKRRLNGPQ